jgi:hypothetical protein
VDQDRKAYLTQLYVLHQMGYNLFTIPQLSIPEMMDIISAWAVANGGTVDEVSINREQASRELIALREKRKQHE